MPTIKDAVLVIATVTVKGAGYVLAIEEVRRGDEVLLRRAP